MPYKDPMPTVGGKVQPALYRRVQRVLKARGGISMQKWVTGMLEFYLPQEEEALGLKRKRRPAQRRPLRNLPPLAADDPIVYPPKTNAQPKPGAVSP